MDFHIEYWNLFQLTKTPTRIVRLTGIKLINLFAAASKFHVRKNTMVIADSMGSARVIKTDSCDFGISDEKLQDHPSSVRYKIETRKKVFNAWLGQWKENGQFRDEGNISLLSFNRSTELLKNNASAKELTSKANKESPYKQQNLFDNMNSWETDEEQIMYKNLLAKKRINISEIESSKGPLMKIIQEKERKYELLQEKYNLRETIFKNALKSLMQRKSISQSKRYEVAVAKETENKIKKCYVREYMSLEEDALRFVKRYSHKFFFDWNVMIQRGKKRPKSIINDDKESEKKYQNIKGVTSKSIVQPNAVK